jgi:hypothetical protein
MEWKDKRSELLNYYWSDFGSDKRRIVKRFLIFPLEMNGTTKWLETVYITQELTYKFISKYDMFTGVIKEHCTWEDYNWSNKKDYDNEMEK